MGKSRYSFEGETFYYSKAQHLWLDSSFIQVPRIIEEKLNSRFNKYGYIDGTHYTSKHTRVKQGKRPYYRICYGGSMCPR